MMDVVIIGGGVAGLSCAAALARKLDVVLIEREDALGYHSTGRSAAVYIEPYLEDLICKLTQLSRRDFEDSALWASDAPILSARGDLRLAPSGHEAEMRRYVERWLPLCPTLEMVREEGVAARLPGARLSGPSIGVWNPDVFDIDVHALSEGYRRRLGERGGRIHLVRELLGATYENEGWKIDTTSGPLSSRWIVNAAGAWADVVAERCGVRPVGLMPKRRTIVQVPPWHSSCSSWPMAHDAANSWYLKSEGDRMLISPADETPAKASDARASDYDVAVAIDRIEQTFGIEIQRVLGRWAGLRTFAPDNLPVIGSDPRQPHFMWCAGQGGYGIQTSPALGVLTASALTGDELPETYQQAGIQLAAMSPERFR